MAWTLWLLPLVVVTLIIAVRPDSHSVTYHYHDAVERWRARTMLYTGPLGMNYLPTFVPLFMPFHLLPREVGDNLWRWLAFAGLVVRRLLVF